MRGAKSVVFPATSFVVLFSGVAAFAAAPGFTYGAGGSSVNPTAVVSTENAVSLAVGSVLNPDVVTPGFIGRSHGEPSTTNSPFVFSGINTATGNYYQTTLDLSVELEGSPFELRRYYNSLDPYVGPLGKGWMHSYDIRIKVLSGGNVRLKDLQGTEIPFKAAGGGKYTPNIPGVYDTLNTISGGRFILTRVNQTVLAFSPTGVLLSIEDPAGNLQRLSYDGSGRLTSVSDKNNKQFLFSYNANNRLISVLSQSTGTTVQYTYNANGDLASFIDANSAITKYTYTANRLLQVVADQLNQNVVQNTFDAQERVASEKDATGATTAFTYSAAQTVIKDPRGNLVKHLYSGFKLIAVIDQLGNRTNYKYDAKNNLVSFTDPSGTTSFSYDARGNRTSVTDELGNRIGYTFDAKNNVVSVRDALGKVTNYTYDADGNRTSATDPLGNKVLSQYDQNGNLLQRTDANGNVTKYAYDANGNLITVTDALGRITKYTYDAKGDKTSVTNAKNNKTIFTYDDYHRLTSVTDPLSNKTTYTYDAAGNLKRITDAKGQITDFIYDEQGRRETISYGGGQTVSFVYDAFGNRTRMTDSTGTTNYVYDNANRLTQVTFPSGKQVRYAYDAAGNLKSLTYPDLKVVAYQYDKTGQLIKLTDWLSRITSYTYDKAGRVTKVVYPNQSQILITFDNAGRVTAVENVVPNNVSSTLAAATVKYTYELDPVGNRVKIIESGGPTTVLVYDKLNQLISHTAGSQTTQYTYDAVGNRTKLQSPLENTVYTYDAADRLQTAGNTTFAFDANGNQISRDENLGIAANFSDTLTTYKYNVANRLIEVANGPVKTTYTYDGDGNRVRQVSGVAQYDYVNDVSTPFVVTLTESGPQGEISYVRGKALVSASSTKGFEFFYHYDGPGSVVGVTSAGGQLQDTISYSPFGKFTVTTQTLLGERNKYFYIGEAFDFAPALYYMRTRYYDASLGRFLSKDPFLGFDETPLTQNLYIYGRNNPLVFKDPTGLVGCSLFDELDWPCAPSLWDE